MITEIWKKVIAGGIGEYEVSNKGNVRNAETGRILKPFRNTGGYLQVDLTKYEGNKKLKKRLFQVHRLVALAFIPNPDKLPIINHKDINPENNEVNNLEWCSYEYNNNYLDRNERMSMHKKKEIEVINSKGEIVDIVKGLIDTMDKYNISKHYIKQSNNGRDLIKAGVSRYNFKIAA